MENVRMLAFSGRIIYSIYVGKTARRQREQNMYEKIRNYVRTHGLLEQGDIVIAGISGGADSVCLLCVLMEMKEEYGLKLAAVHVNHGIRGEAADADESFVEKLCRSAGVPLTCFHINVKKLAEQEGLSEEEAGRTARRRAFEKTAKEYGAGKIALAHHKNDNAETVLLNLARGTGLKGLGGIRPRSGMYIRPLLAVSRQEIEDFLQKKNQPYCMDATNYEDTYTRNRIRNHIIPYMEQKVNAGFTDHLCSTAQQMAQLWDYMEELQERACARCMLMESGRDGTGNALLIYGGEFKKVDRPLRPYILHRALEKVCGRKKDLEAVHIEALEHLFEKQVGKQLDLPYGMQAKRCYEGVRIEPENWEMPVPDSETDRVTVRVLDAAAFRQPADQAIPQSPYTKWFDYDIINHSVVIRTRRPGDYIVIGSNGESQKLNRYFINEKIPAEQRDRILLAAAGSRILWIIGYRREQGCRVTRQTKKILEITYE